MATPHLISVPISPYCPACGWEFAQNQAVEGNINRFCGSCGVDLSISQFDNSGGNQPSDLLPGVVSGVTPGASQVSFFVVINPDTDTDEFRSRVNAGAWSSWAAATAGDETILVGGTDDVADFQLRASVTGPPALTGNPSVTYSGVAL